MSLRRVNPKRDGNEKRVVAALTQAGVVTYRLSSADLPDLLCGYRGRYFLIEVKSAKGRLEPGQVAFHAMQRALWLPCYVVRSVDEALALLTAEDYYLAGGEPPVVEEWAKGSGFTPAELNELRVTANSLAGSRRPLDLLRGPEPAQPQHPQQQGQQHIRRDVR